jgi:hypothetical protein
MSAKVFLSRLIFLLERVPSVMFIHTLNYNKNGTRLREMSMFFSYSKKNHGFRHLTRYLHGYRIILNDGQSNIPMYQQNT